jgi:hypothetical protein
MYDLTRHRDTSIRTLVVGIVPKSRFLLYSGLCWPVLLFLTHQPNRGGYEKSGGCPPVGVRFPYGRLSSQLNYVPLGHPRYANTVAQERNPPGVACQKLTPKMSRPGRGLSSPLNYVPLGHPRYANTVAQERNPPRVACQSSLRK